MPLQILFWLAVAAMIGGFTLLELSVKYERVVDAPKWVQILSVFCLLVFITCSAAFCTLFFMSGLHALGSLYYLGRF